MKRNDEENEFYGMVNDSLRDTWDNDKDSAYDEKRVEGIKINGTVLRDSKEIGHDEFLEEFIKFVESKGWSFIGHTNKIKE